MSKVPGMFALGEANFSDHGANRLGASALMQGLADGYFVIPYTLGDYLANNQPADKLGTDAAAFNDAEARVSEATKKLLSINGTKTPSQYHRELGKRCLGQRGEWAHRKSCKRAVTEIQALREDFWKNLKVDGQDNEFNKNLEFAGRVSDFLELGELLAIDCATPGNESCGGHFREEYQQEDGEALRDDENFCYVGAWKYTGDVSKPELHKELLSFDPIHLQTRSYK